MYPAAFNYRRASSFAAAAQMLADNPDAKPLAGGQTLIPMMKLRLIKPNLLVDLTGIGDASDVVIGDEAVEIGALAAHKAIGLSALGDRFPIVRDCALGIADTQIRNLGTIGGSLAEADPCSCWPALLVALDAEVLCEGPDGLRQQSVRELLADAYTPNLALGELVTRVAIAREVLRGVGAFVAFKRAAPAYPTGSCAMQIDYEGERIASLRIGFGCMGLTPVPFDAADAIAAGRTVSADLIEEVAEAAAAHVEPIADAKGSEAYKRALAGGLVRRAFAIVESRRLGRPCTGTHQYYG